MDEIRCMNLGKIDNWLTEEQTPIIEALAKLNKNGDRVLFVHNNGKLLASLTDGDVRRYILNKGDLHGCVSQAANYCPQHLHISQRENAREFLQSKQLDGVPLVDGDGYIIDIILGQKNAGNIKKKRLHVPVVMMAGGKGRRLYPYTRILPKPLIPIGEIPISEHIINSFYEVGCQDFYLIVNYKKNMLKAYFNELYKDYNIHFIDEEKPLGTGGGLSLLKGVIRDTFILTNCDILINECFERIYRFHREKRNIITMICSLKNFQIPYGIVNLGDNGTVSSMTEKPSVPFLTNTGCYVVEPQVIEELPDNTPLSFPDIIQHCRDNGGKIGVFPIGDDAWLDMGVPEEMENMRARLGVNSLEKLF